MLEKDSLKKIVNLPNNTNEELIPISREYIEGLFENLGDDSNPIDYYTKQQSDEKFATKSNVEANTTSISALRTEVESAKQYGVDFKTEVASAITAKNVPTLATDDKATFVNNINSIKTGIEPKYEFLVNVSIQLEEPSNPKKGDVWILNNEGLTPTFSVNTPQTPIENMLWVSFRDIYCKIILDDSINTHIIDGKRSFKFSLITNNILSGDTEELQLLLRNGYSEIYASFAQSQIYKDGYWLWTNSKVYNGEEFIPLTYEKPSYYIIDTTAGSTDYIRKHSYKDGQIYVINAQYDGSSTNRSFQLKAKNVCKDWNDNLYLITGNNLGKLRKYNNKGQMIKEIDISKYNLNPDSIELSCSRDGFIYYARVYDSYYDITKYDTELNQIAVRRMSTTRQNGYSGVKCLCDGNLFYVSNLSSIGGCQFMNSNLETIAMNYNGISNTDCVSADADDNIYWGYDSGSTGIIWKYALNKETNTVESSSFTITNYTNKPSAIQTLCVFVHPKTKETLIGFVSNYAIYICNTTGSVIAEWKVRSSSDTTNVYPIFANNLGEVYVGMEWNYSSSTKGSYLYKMSIDGVKTTIYSGSNGLGVRQTIMSEANDLAPFKELYGL